MPRDVLPTAPIVIPIERSLPGENATLARIQVDRNGALAIAVRNSTALLSGLADVAIASANIDVQKLPMRTTFSLSGENQGIITPGLQYDPRQPFQWNQSVSVSQTISTFGRVKWGVLAAQLTRKQSAQNYRTALFGLLSRVDTLYAQSVFAIERLRIAEARLEQRKSFLATSERLFTAGIVAEYDVLQYRSSCTQAYQSLEAAENDAQQARIALLTEMGLRPDVPADIVVPPIHPPAPPASLDEGLAQAFARRPELAALRWALSAAEAQIEVAARINTPTLGLTTTYEALNGDVGQAPDNDWTVSLNLSVNLGDGGAARLQRRIARQTLVQVRQSLESESRKVAKEVASAYTRLVSLWQQRKSAEIAVTQSLEALQIAMLRYQEGVSGSFELLNSQEAYISSRQALANIVTEYYIALVEWRRSIAQDWGVALPPTLQVDWEFPRGAAPPESWREDAKKRE